MLIQLLRAAPLFRVMFAREGLPRMTTYPDLIAMVEELQQAVRRADLARSQALIDELRRYKLPAEVSQSIDVAQADVFQQQREFGRAQALIGRVLARPAAAWVRGQALVMLANFDLREGTVSDATIARFREAVDVARGVHDNGIEGDALFNIGNILCEREQYDEARQHYVDARATYLRGERPDKVLDCDHVLATLGRVAGKLTPEDLQVQRDVVMRALEREDLGLISRAGGDLLRSLYGQHVDGVDGALDEAAQVSYLVRDAEQKLWEQASRASSLVGAQTEAAIVATNNLEILLQLAFARGEEMEALYLLTIAKARTTRSVVLSRVREKVESFRSVHPALASRSLELLAANTAPNALSRLAGERGKVIALLDFFAISHGRLVTSIVIDGGPAGATSGAYREAWPGRPLASPEPATDRGRGHGAEGIARVRRLDTLLLSAAGRSRDLMSLDAELAPWAADAAAEQDETLRELGAWFFPAQLIKMLVEEGVEELIVVPDPRLYSVPWYALYDATGMQVIDRGWTITLVPSAISLFEMLAPPPSSGRLAVFAPLDDVNQKLGGDQEVASISASFPQALVVRGDAATSRALSSVLKAGDWAHACTHGVKLDQAYVPRMFDGPWRWSDDDATPGSFLVTATCLTGATTAAGQDVFGLVEIVSRLGISGAILPIVAVEGHATAAMMDELYRALAAGATAAAALRQAALVMRSRMPHPIFWAAFFCTGDGSRRVAP